MNRLRSVTFFALFVLLAGLPLFAQQTIRARNVVDVPFAFVAGGVTLPAGQYTIESPSETTLRISGPGGSVDVLTNETMASSEVSDSKLVFTKQGDLYVLHQVWTQGHSHAHNLVHNGDVPDL